MRGLLLFLIALGQLLVLTPAKAETRCEKCSVVIVAIDAWGMSPDPESKEFAETAPRLTAFLKQSVFFRQAISASSWTFPSFFSLLSGSYPSFHGMTNHFESYTPEKKVTRTLRKTSPHLLLASDFFRSQGYRTGAFTGGAALSQKYGYAQGFGKFYQTRDFGGLEKSGAEALRWIRAQRRQPFFAFVHTYDLHGQGPTNPAGKPGVAAYVSQREGTLSRKGKALNAASAAEWAAWHRVKLAETDAKFGAFLNELDKIAAPEKVVVALVSDHGSELLEHGGIGHGHSLYEELIRVPLAIRAPGIAAGKVSEQVSTVDIFPTLAGLSGAGDPKDAPGFAAQLQGESQAAAMRLLKAVPRDVFSETEYRDSAFKTAVRTSDGWKYIFDLLENKEELYLLAADPGEKNDLSTDPKHDAILVSLREKVALFRKKYSTLRFSKKKAEP